MYPSGPRFPFFSLVHKVARRLLRQRIRDLPKRIDEKSPCCNSNKRSFVGVTSALKQRRETSCHSRDTDTLCRSRHSKVASCLAQKVSALTEKFWERESGQENGDEEDVKREVVCYEERIQAL